VSHWLDYFLCAPAGDLGTKNYSVYSDSDVCRVWATFLLCLFMSCIFMSCNFMSCNFTSCNFMPCILVRQFHALQFHAQHIGPSFSCPAISCPAFSAPPWKVNVVIPKCSWLIISTMAGYTASVTIKHYIGNGVFGMKWSHDRWRQWSVNRDLGMFGREIHSIEKSHGIGQTLCSYERYLVLLVIGA